VPGGAAEGPAFGIDVGELVAAIRSNLRPILLTGLLTAAVTAGVSLLRPNVYDATVTLVPNEAHRGPGGIDLGKATDLAQAVGISLPGGDGASTYATVVESRRVMEEVMGRRFFVPEVGATAPLDSLFRAEARTPARGRAEALAWLRESVSTSVDARTGVWLVAMRHESPETASEVANAIVDAAERYRREQTTREAQKTRRFIEERMDSTRVHLKAAEEGLKDFRTENVRINKSPELLLAEGRLIRDARIQEEIFLTLTKQYELAKINEAYHQPELVVLDWAEPPAFKSGPMRTRMVLASGVLGTLVGLCLVLLRHYFPAVWEVVPRIRRKAA
jgi:uncharacterized protein involved in exopolysaccharide biosynthesis